MKKSDRDAWVAALRSGKYEQGGGCLRVLESYCCLGVAADVLGGSDPDKWVKQNHPLDDSFTFRGNTEMLDEDTARKWGLEGHQTRLAAMNDNGETFAEIADWIEANIPVDA